MLVFLYPLSLAASILLLAAWFYFQERSWAGKLFRGLFFVALVAYGASMLLSGGDWADKWQVVVKDLMIMAAIPVILTIFKSRQWVYFILLGVAALFVAQYLKKQVQFLQTSAEQATTSSNTSPKNPEGEWELLVEVKEDHQFQELQQVIERFQLAYEPAFQLAKGGDTDLDDYYAVEIPAHQESKLAEIQEALMATGLVDWVEENETITVAPLTPARSAPINKRFGINDPDLEKLWGFELMQVDKLYTYIRENQLKPKKVAKIAILDTGVDAKHEDLKGQFFSVKSAYNKDVRAHGTHCAGIAAAVSNNAVGVASFSPEKGFVKVTSIKVLSDYGVGSQRGIINGILEAADKGVDVISMSLGGRSNQSRQRAYNEAIRYARKAGAIVVAAAGNDGSNAKYTAPANSEGLITVAAIDTLGNKASFSNTVEDVKMGIAAPGVAIYSTIPDNKYAAFSGTSMATPYVAGLLGLMRSLDPNLTTEKAYEMLKSTGKASSTPNLTGPIIQPYLALQKL